MAKFIFPFFVGLLGLGFSLSGQETDAFRWLESVDSDEALQWVRAHNQPTLDFLSDQPGFQDKKAAALAILTASDRIISGELRGDWVYNFWRSADQPQGIWRRTSYQNYRTGTYEWETMLDLDALSSSEGINWVWKGVHFLTADNPSCLIEISDGGKDAAEVREFDLHKKTFVKEGFSIPEAKSNYSWANENAIWLATRFDDNSLTESGYPRVLKLLKRGQSLEEAAFIFEADPSHVSVTPISIKDGDTSYSVFIDEFTFFEGLHYLLQNDGSFTLLPIQPSDQLAAIHKGQCVVQTRKSWQIEDHTYPGGSLISFDLQAFLKNGTLTNLQILFEPTDTVAIAAVSNSNSALIVNFNDNVTNRIACFEYTDDIWHSHPVDLPNNGTIEILSASDDSHLLFLGYESFLTPDSLIELDSKTGQWETIQSLPTRFDTNDLVVEQKHATSKDGTQVPYFIVHRKDLVRDGSNPTFLYGYGGFEVSMNPFYLSTYGKLWVEPGNVFVLANIRGGGEFGPNWHQAALKHNRQRAYDDFHAIAEALIAEKITSPQHLGIGGGSNGGLLVGVAFTQRPDLYNAVFCAVPLLDMLRYHELPPGASWIAEYGDPRIPEDRETIAAYSPYQNLDEAKHYPKVFFYTSTRDDRVHPGHARKMAAKMESMEHPFFYFERIEGGHAGGANLVQYAELYALEFTYLQIQLQRCVKNP